LQKVSNNFNIVIDLFDIFIWFLSSRYLACPIHIDLPKKLVFKAHLRGLVAME